MGWAVPVTADALQTCLGSRRWPRTVDVRRRNAFELAPSVLPGATWRDHRAAAEWGREYRDAPWVVVYCAHGEQLSQGAAAVLRSAGVNASFLEGGFSAWHSLSAPTIARAKVGNLGPERPSRWVTATRPTVNQLACPWFVRRFVEPEALFHFVAAEHVAAVAQEIGAVAYDVLGVPFPPDPVGTTLEAMVSFFDVSDPPLQRLATIVQAADSGAFELAPQSAGVAALAAGLAAGAENEGERFAAALTLFDALYAWARSTEPAQVLPHAGAARALPQA
ncbi:MAG: chromate resistance protein [Defluviicoccus sp.]|nr:chromate resistance protein [Defluviicoccus sp.]